MAEQKKDSEQKRTASKKDAQARGAAKQGGRSTAKAKKPAAQKGTAKPAESKSSSKASGEKKADKPATSRAKSQAAARTEGSGAKAASKPKQKAKQEAEREAPTVRAKASYVRVAPRKARLVADQVRGLPLEDARTLLRFSPRSAARDLIKLIDSAAANAENNHDLIADELRIADIRVDEGPTLRRYRARALGRATRINKRTSHIQVALTPEGD